MLRPVGGFYGHSQPLTAVTLCKTFLSVSVSTDLARKLEQASAIFLESSGS